MIDWLKRRFMMRLVLGLVALCAILIITGIAETVRVLRWVFPPTSITFAQATGAEGLAAYGHVRITDAVLGSELAPVSRSDGTWSGAYAAILPAPGAPGGAGSTMVAWFKGAQSADDVEEFIADHGLEGFVEGRADFANSNDSRAFGHFTGPDRTRSWILRLHRPSWLRALILFGTGAGLAGLSLWAWLSRPLEP